MKMKRLATRPTAFVAGVWTPLALAAFDVWAASHPLSAAVTRLIYLSVYLIAVIGPFVVFVVAVDPERWEAHYMFGPKYQADYPQVLIRWLFWFLGTLGGGLVLRLRS
jgi:hypothetical protein